MFDADKIYDSWFKIGATRLNLSSTPNPLPQSDESIIIVKQSFQLLAELLEFLQKMYFTNKNSFNDRHFAFIGNEVIREWPNKDIEFFSENALIELKKNPTAKLHKEHYTPISFFRDTFSNQNRFSKNEFYSLLAKHYRIVFITEEENKKLEKAGYRSCRPANAYEMVGIKIANKPFWNKLMDELTK